MYRVLQGACTGKPQRAKHSKSKGKRAVDIALIGAAPFSCHVKNPEVEIFTTSLHKIERTIKEINSNKASTGSSDEAIWRSLPAEYQEFQDVFSKQASDTLPPS